jgi:hypothetical protein
MLDDIVQRAVDGVKYVQKKQVSGENEWRVCLSTA